MHLVADRDRDRVSASLRRHYERGRLTVEELGERMEVAVRARSDVELRAALRDLPAPWARAELAPVAAEAGRLATRALLFCALAAAWSVVSLVLLVVFLVVLAADASAATELAVPLSWAALTFLLWRAWQKPRRPARLG